MIPLKNKDELKEFLEYCEQAVEKTGNTLNERGPLQRDHFCKIQHPALKYQNQQPSWSCYLRLHGQI